MTSVGRPSGGAAGCQSVVPAASAALSCSRGVLHEHRAWAGGAVGGLDRVPPRPTPLGALPDERDGRPEPRIRSVDDRGCHRSSAGTGRSTCSTIAQSGIPRARRQHVSLDREWRSLGSGEPRAMSTVVVSEEWRVQALRDLDVARHRGRRSKPCSIRLAIDLHVADDPQLASPRGAASTVVADDAADGR